VSDAALGWLVDGDWLALDLAQARCVSDAGLAAALRQLPRLRALDLSGRATPGLRSSKSWSSLRAGVLLMQRSVLREGYDRMQGSAYLDCSAEHTSRRMMPGDLT